MNLSARRKMELSSPAIQSRIINMKVAYEDGFGKVSKMEMPAPLPIAFTAKPFPMEQSSVTFEHREVLGTGDTWESALADWRCWLDKCPQSGKELIWRVPPEIDCWCDFKTDKLIWKVYARMIIIPEDITMTDITRKLELIANLKPGQSWPDGLGPAMDWGTALSAICAEALAEINRLRAHERASEKWLAELLPVTDAEKAFIAYGTQHPGMAPPDRNTALEECFSETEGIATVAVMAEPGAVYAEPAPEPWGSPFAMNTENWK
jgi:hypothetical protein